jgi:hypothetical protein
VACHASVMKKIVLTLSLALVFITTMGWLGQSVQAAQTVPLKINFQGKLTDTSGAPMPDGLYNLRFNAYFGAPTGGTPAWTETHATTNRVSVKNGVFSTDLGSLTPFSAGDFTGYVIYIEVELPTPATATCDGTACSPSWTEGAMTPRYPIASAPYAMNTDTVDGIDGAALAQLSTSNTFTGSNLFKPSSDSTTAFQIQKSDTTPLLVADTTNLALKVGGGDVSPNASPALLVLDYKNTSGDPASTTNGAMYYNSNTSKFRCYEGGAWKDCIYSDPFITSSFNYQQEFAAQAAMTIGFFPAGSFQNLDSTLSIFANRQGSGVNTIASEANHPSLWRFATGATAAGNAFTSSRIAADNVNMTTPYRLGEGTWEFNTGVRVGTISATGELYVLILGVSGTVTGTAKGCMFRYNIADYSGDWTGVCGNGTSETKCDITNTPGTPGNVPVVASTWYKLKFVVNSAGSSATFVVNDTYSCTVPSNIPTGVSLPLLMGIAKTTGTTSRTMDLDYLDFTYNTSGR